MGTYEKGAVRIYFEEAGSGFPLLVIAGGGLKSIGSGLSRNSPFDPIEEFKGEYRFISSGLCNANCGRAYGPPEVCPPLGLVTHGHLRCIAPFGLGQLLA